MDASPAYSRAPKPSSPIGGLLEFAANLSPLAGERKHSSGPTPAELRRQDHHVPNLCHRIPDPRTTRTSAKGSAVFSPALLCPASSASSLAERSDPSLLVSLSH